MMRMDRVQERIPQMELMRLVLLSSPKAAHPSLLRRHLSSPGTHLIQNQLRALRGRAKISQTPKVDLTFAIISPLSTWASSN